MPFHLSVIMPRMLDNLLNSFISTGIFTVPVSGVYLFTYMVDTFVDAYQLVVKLVVDGVNYSDGISDPFHNLQVNIKSEMRSFKSNENIHNKEGGSYYVVSANKASSVTL